jgi:hypothetical protein
MEKESKQSKQTPSLLFIEPVARAMPPLPWVAEHYVPRATKAMH